MVPRPTRKKAEAQFWDAVTGQLTGTYGHTPAIARRGVARYKDEAQQHSFTDVVYNQGEEHTARVIDGLIQHGLPQTDVGAAHA